jgi:uncharacterized protein YndB with AHSA1/START domain
MGKNVVVITPSEREILVERVFDAPASLVFEAHTKPELVRKWLLGPPGWSMPVCEIDLRVGGRFHYMWRRDADGAEFSVRGEFREIVAPVRIVHSERMGEIGHTGESEEGISTLTLVERDGRTTLGMRMLFGSRELRDQALKSGMTVGMSMSYDRLEAMLC